MLTQQQKLISFMMSLLLHLSHSLPYHHH